MLEKNYKLAEMIFLEQVIGAEELDVRGSERKSEVNSEEEWSWVSWAIRLREKL